MKAHFMEVHHEVYRSDPEWIELVVDDEHKKQLKTVWLPIAHRLVFYHFC